MESLLPSRRPQCVRYAFRKVFIEEKIDSRLRENDVKASAGVTVKRPGPRVLACALRRNLAPNGFACATSGEEVEYKDGA